MHRSRIKKMNRIVLFVLLTILYNCSLMAQDKKGIYPVLAHAHNDYDKKQPVSNALEYNFDALEVDIILYNNRIVVSHDEDDLDKKPDFLSFYFIPLLESVKHSSRKIILLVDIKIYSDQLIEKLNSICSAYPELLENRFDAKGDNKKLQILLSGDIPRKKIIEEPNYIYFYIDGRIEDLEFEYSNYYMPWISMNYTDISRWKGLRYASINKRKLIDDIVNRVHSEKKKIRFWNTKDSKRTWDILMAQGVDVIGVDNVKLFSDSYVK